MKLQVAAALCLFMLVASEMAVTSDAAACDFKKLSECLPASKDANVIPNKFCCINIEAMGEGVSGAKCFCSLLTQPQAKSKGVVLSIALGIPKRCHLTVPKGFVCKGIPLPGS